MLKRFSVALLLVAAVAIQVNAQAIKTFTVTNSGATAYRFDGGTTNNPTMTLYRGHTYKFNWTATPGHPFFLDRGVLNDAAAVHLGAADGVAEDNTAMILTFTVPAGATSPVFYQCGIHDPMSGTLTITDAPPVPALGTVTLAGLAVLVLAVGYLARRRKSGSV